MCLKDDPRDSRAEEELVRASATLITPFTELWRAVALVDVSG